MQISDESIEEIDKEIGEESMRKVEAALFIAGKFMSLQELVALTDVNPILLKKVLEDLSEKYKDSGIEIINKNNLWKMDVSSNYVGMVNKLAAGSSEFTRAEQETLALIAYKQPMKQSVVVKIRGNKAYEHIKHFREIGLVIAKKAGHTIELRLSNEFFDYFHLGKKEDGGKIIAVEIKEEDDESDEENKEHEVEEKINENL